MPASHGVQPAAPMCEYFPASHVWHLVADGLGAKLPAGHTRQLDWPGVLPRSAPQLLHTVAPYASW